MGESQSCVLAWFRLRTRGSDSQLIRTFREYLPAISPHSCRPEGSPMRTPVTVYHDVRNAYLKYVDTAYWLRDPVLMKERRRLLKDGDALFTDVLLEPVVPYDSTLPLGEVAAEAGLSQATASIVGDALFGGFARGGQPILLRDHQADALRRSL